MRKRAAAAFLWRHEFFLAQINQVTNILTPLLKKKLVLKKITFSESLSHFSEMPLSHFLIVSLLLSHLLRVTLSHFLTFQRIQSFFSNQRFMRLSFLPVTKKCLTSIITIIIIISIINLLIFGKNLFQVN